MLLIKPSHSLRAFFSILCLALWLLPAFAVAEDIEDIEDIEDSSELFNAWQQSSSSSSRAPKPLSLTAENVYSLTAADIRALNAHTLADILSTIPGVQVSQLGGNPANVTYTYLQSSLFNHVLVLVDGVHLNNADNNSAVNLIPADIIESVEIVKGAASSAWGQALGGVINVTTKTPDNRKIGGMVSASIGERTTTDDHAELSGTIGRFGYYLYGGYLGSDGLLPNTQVQSNNIYAKLNYDLPNKGKLSGTLRYSRAGNGNYSLLQFKDIYSFWDFKEEQKTHDLSASIEYSHTVSDRLKVEFLTRHFSNRLDLFQSKISDNLVFFKLDSRYQVTGADLKAIWRGDRQLLVAGGSYEHVESKNTDVLEHADQLNRKIDRWGVFLNDTIKIGPFAVIPGVRFDRTGDGDQFSPSIGATWQLSENTLLRGYTARGYSQPSLVLTRGSEKVWTSQVGMETSAVPFIWLKGTLFRNETWNISDTRNADPSVPERRMALGAELELHTIPVFHTSLGAGYTFTDITRTSDDHQVYASPRHTVQLALRYNDSVYRGLLTGRHVYWNGVPEFNGKYAGLLWDLHLGATFLKRENSSLELFFSGRNLFNGKQYQDELQPNTGRWFEGGLRVRF